MRTLHAMHPSKPIPPAALAEGGAFGHVFNRHATRGRQAQERQAARRAARQKAREERRDRAKAVALAKALVPHVDSQGQPRLTKGQMNRAVELLSRPGVFRAEVTIVPMGDPSDCSGAERPETVHVGVDFAAGRKDTTVVTVQKMLSERVSRDFEAILIENGIRIVDDDPTNLFDDHQPDSTETP